MGELVKVIIEKKGVVKMTLTGDRKVIREHLLERKWVEVDGELRREGWTYTSNGWS